MSKTVIAVESPHKAKLIQGFLGKDYTVLATVGHFREMPEPKKMTKEEKKKYTAYALDLNNNFEPLLKVKSESSKIVKKFRDAIKNAESLVIATDDDAEGALIGLYLIEVLKPKIPVYRATWHEITKVSVNKGLQDKELVDLTNKTPTKFFRTAESASTRAAWDRLYGFATSPYLWRTLMPNLSSGRVQVPGAKLVVEREEKRLAFKSISYYSITGVFENNEATLMEVNGKKIANGSNIDSEGNIAEGYVLITDKNIDKLMDFLKTKEYKVGDVKSKAYRRTPPPPFTTSSALQSIGGKTGMSAKQITAILQNLYASEGAITYIRTVSVTVAPEAIEAARKELGKRFGKNYVYSTPRLYKDKKEENSGHEAIRPVVENNLFINKNFNDTKVQKVFDLVYNRMLASQAIDCEGTTWTANFLSTDEKVRFSASQTEIHEPGWTKVYSDDEITQE